MYTNRIYIYTNITYVLRRSTNTYDSFIRSHWDRNDHHRTLASEDPMGEMNKLINDTMRDNDELFGVTQLDSTAFPERFNYGG